MTAFNFAQIVSIMAMSGAWILAPNADFARGIGVGFLCAVIPMTVLHFIRS